MSYESDIISSLLPASSSGWWGMPAPKPVWGSDNVGTLLEEIQRTKDVFIQLALDKAKLYKQGREVQSSVDYTGYLQLGNPQIKALARSLVSPSDSNDAKAAKLLDWVKGNVEYADDLKTYKQSEYWALPTMTLRRGQGDCEDGAFLLASLMLNAGVDQDRVRVYGGFVSDGTIEATGGHAWVAYQREQDDEWVALDWCYYPTDDSIEERQTLASDSRYMDDYFYVEATKTIETPYVNTLRLPAGYQRALSQGPGQILNAVA